MSRSIMLPTTEKASIIDKYRPDLAPFEDVYWDTHRKPELSGLGVRTANIAASHLEGFVRFLVHRRFGGRNSKKWSRLRSSSPCGHECSPPS